MLINIEQRDKALKKWSAIWNTLTVISFIGPLILYPIVLFYFPESVVNHDELLVDVWSYLEGQYFCFLGFLIVEYAFCSVPLLGAYYWLIEPYENLG